QLDEIVGGLQLFTHLVHSAEGLEPDRCADDVLQRELERLPIQEHHWVRLEIREPRRAEERLRETICRERVSLGKDAEIALRKSGERKNEIACIAHRTAWQLGKTRRGNLGDESVVGRRGLPT